MKKYILVLVVLMVMLSVLFTGCSGDKSMKQIEKDGKFVVGLDDSFPPMGFRSDSGEIIGFDIDLAKEAAKRMGVEVEFKPVDWDGVILSLTSGDIDVIWNGLTITQERKEKIGFSKPYLNNRQIIIVSADSEIATKADLAEKNVGVQMGSSGDEAINAEKEVMDTFKDLIKFSNYTEALLDLNNGGVEAVVMDEIVGRYYIEKNPGDYKILEENFGEEQYGVGYRKEDKAFGEELDKVLDEMKKDGTTKKISEEWFGEDIVVK